MRKFVLCIALLSPALHATWSAIPLPHTKSYPCEQDKCSTKNSSQVFALELPKSGVTWHTDPDCKNDEGKSSMRSTGQKFASDQLDNVSGLSFKGAFRSSGAGSRRNAFGIFFHEQKCYHGGGEYGWVFPESRKEGVFYLCSDCNLTGKQRWCTWPDIGEGKCPATGDCFKLKTLLDKPGLAPYWNIKVTKVGGFEVEVVDPVTWKKLSCNIDKPAWLPNLYKKKGYLTINAQKREEGDKDGEVAFRVDEVKVWKE